MALKTDSTGSDYLQTSRVWLVSKNKEMVRSRQKNITNRASLAMFVKKYILRKYQLLTEIYNVYNTK